MDCRSSDSCRKLFFNIEILPLLSQYILSLLLFLIKIMNQFMVNSEIYHIDTRQHANFQHISMNVTKYQKGEYYLGVKVFNMLPSDIKKESDNIEKFRLTVQKFLYENSFYSLDEYFEFKKIKFIYILNWPLPVAAQSSAARLLQLWVQIPPGAWMFVCCECCLLSGRGLCDGLITRPEDSYRQWCVVVCDQETSNTRRLKPATGL